MRFNLQQQQFGYLVAVGANLALIAIKIAFEEIISDSALSLLAISATALASHFGGMRAGLVSTALNAGVAVSGIFYSQGWSGSPPPDTTFVLSLYLLSGWLVSWLLEANKTNRPSLQPPTIASIDPQPNAYPWRQRYEAAVLASGSILYDSNRLTGDVLYGGECEKVLGYTAEELNGNVSVWIDLIHPDDRDYFSSEVNRTNADHSPYQADYRMRRKDGQFIWMRDDGHFTVKTQTGDPERIIGLVKDVTQQRHTEIELERLSQRLSSLFDNTPLAVIEWDSDFNIIRWTGQAQTTFGWTAVETVGRTHERLCVQQSGDQACFQSVVDRLKNANESFLVFHEKTLSKSGQLLSCEWYNSAARDADGQVIAVLSLVHDITEREHAEIALRESEERFRLLTDAMPQVVWIANRDGDVCYYNSRVQNWAGATQHANGSWKWQCVLHPDDLDRTVNSWFAAVRNQTQYQCEHRVRMQDGSYRWHLSRALPTISGPNHELRWFGSATDIHDLKQSQESLQESEERFRAFMDNNPSAAFLKDASGRYIFVNRALEIAYNRPASQWIGRTDTDFLTVSDTAHLSTNDHLVLGNRKAIETEETLDDVDGPRHYLTFKFPIQGHDGRVMLGGFSLDITERKRAEMHAEAQRERVQLVADAVPALISFIDADAQYQLVNRAYERWFGSHQSEMLGQPMRKVLGEAAWNAIHPHVIEVLNGRTVNYEAQVPYRDGGTRWISATYTPVLSKNGAVRGFIAHVNDITARKLAEDELIYQRSLLQAITDNAQTSIFLIDAKGDTLFVNPAGEEMTGFSRQELVGKNMNVHFQPLSGSEQLLNASKSYFDCASDQTQAARNRESVFVHKSGLLYPIRWNARAVCRDGQTIATVAEVWDITKEKKAEQDLQATRNQLEAIIETAPSLIVVTDSSGRVLMFNKACEKITGFTRAESYQKKLFDLLVPEEGRDKLKKRFLNADASTLKQPHESLWITKDGSRRFIEWRCTHLASGSNPTETLLLGIGVDTTDRRRLEDELRNHADRLAESDRRKDEFLATLAHELRNPLAPIRLGLELLKMASNDLETIENTRLMMERQTLQLITLVDDLLDVSRITRGKLELRKSLVVLADVIQSAVEASRPGIDEAGHSLTLEVPEKAILLIADPHRLAQILSNLLNNSVKYTPQGGSITLSCSLERNEIVLAVKDTGIGVPPEMQTAIFDMFAQIDRSIERGYAGLGIGLTLVKSLVEMHGGTIELHSEGINRGSEFKVRLPLLVEQPDLAIQDESVKTNDSSVRCRVLIVDDNEAAADMLAMVVRMQGHEVATASDGQEAIQRSSEFLPQMILMDIGMPKMNGYDAVRAIRKQPWGKNILIVALTGWGQDEDKRRTKAAGFDHHLVKPAEPAEVQRLIRIAESQAISSDIT